LPQTGTYVIEIGGWNYKSGGSYNLVIERHADDQTAQPPDTSADCWSYLPAYTPTWTPTSTPIATRTPALSATP
jgi:hypothetical protein